MQSPIPLLSKPYFPAYTIIRAWQKNRRKIDSPDARKAIIGRARGGLHALIGPSRPPPPIINGSPGAPTSLFARLINSWRERGRRVYAFVFNTSPPARRARVIKIRPAERVKIERSMRAFMRRDEVILARGTCLDWRLAANKITYALFTRLFSVMGWNCDFFRVTRNVGVGCLRDVVDDYMQRLFLREMFLWQTHRIIQQFGSDWKVHCISNTHVTKLNISAIETRETYRSIYKISDTTLRHSIRWIMVEFPFYSYASTVPKTGPFEEEKHSGQWANPWCMVYHIWSIFLSDVFCLSKIMDDSQCTVAHWY